MSILLWIGFAIVAGAALVALGAFLVIAGAMVWLVNATVTAWFSR